jgi:hypothetical protein
MLTKDVRSCNRCAEIMLESTCGICPACVLELAQAVAVRRAVQVAPFRPKLIPSRPAHES